MEKPWGRFEQYTRDMLCTVKIIAGAAAGILSRQYHHKGDEHWVALDTGACAELDGKVLRPDAQVNFLISCETLHRLSSTGSSPVRILEISFGEFDENNVIRLEDIFGRAAPQSISRHCST